MEKGWVKLYRQITDWEWFTEPATAHLFIYLLAKANHKPTRYKGVEIPAGGLTTSREALSKATGLSERQIRTALKHLISTNEVTKKSTRKYTLLIVNNWNLYQGIDQQNDQQVTNKRPTGDQQVTSNKNDKNVRMEECKKREGACAPPRSLSSLPSNKKIGFGPYNNVLLTQEQVDQLSRDYPTQFEESLESMSRYIQTNKGVPYKDCYTKLRSWIMQDIDRKQNKPAAKKQELPDWYADDGSDDFRKLADDLARKGLI